VTPGCDRCWKTADVLQIKAPAASRPRFQLYGHDALMAFTHETTGTMLWFRYRLLVILTFPITSRPNCPPANDEGGYGY